MNLASVYSDKHLVSDPSVFTKHRKDKLNIVELLGLEHILQAFIREYEENIGWICHFTDITRITRYNSDGVDILDGYYDTYLFDNVAIDSIWMTTGGCVMLSCFQLPEEAWSDEDEWLRCNDLYECEELLYRLD